MTRVLIAATAHAHGARFYTRSAADLRDLEDLVEIVAGLTGRVQGSACGDAAFYGCVEV